MRIDWSPGATLLALTMFGAAIAAEPQPCLLSPLPPNVEFHPRDLEAHIARIYERSPTFRSQCARIREAGSLRIIVVIDAAMPSHCRAFSVIQRQGGWIRAEVHLPPSTDHSELLAHEFEHILEQIEGLDLRRLARIRGSGVREVQDDMFESDRAQSAGRIVMAESTGRIRMAQKVAD
jgi:hypothetical protein